ncbi:YutD-like domain-containing protein [Lentilactobacillus sp. Marseille-Q4993]|uniref:YutD-like domain-containing protein n=1 Tax=Lentilactobacillus sp. Marseille-Q4993 TaxID=3039492 RepID=UPI0024BCF984|nr:YutD-like domain-containing protein [Lentilactobacillus sp. Marseille-Q4993]
MEKNQLDALIEQKNQQESPLAKIVRVSENEITVNEHKYTIDNKYLKSFNFDDFVKRFNPAFSQFDYLVGDYSYDQLRLKGFFESNKENVNGPYVEEISEYVVEIVNFGAPYYVLHNLEAKPTVKKRRHNNSRRRPRRSNNSQNKQTNNNPKPYKETVKKKTRPAVKNRKNATVSHEKKANKHKFVIKENKENIED